MTRDVLIVEYVWIKYVRHLGLTRRVLSQLILLFIQGTLFILWCILFILWFILWYPWNASVEPGNFSWRAR